MEHYYSKNPTSKSEEKEINYFIMDKQLKFIVDNGVFSKSHIDIATNFMLKTIIKNEKIEGDILDVGCGYGVIGITIKKFFENTKITMIDINERALNLAKRNAKLNKIDDVTIIESDGFSNINNKYDAIITNPPIRAGKEVIYKIYKDSFQSLKNGGKLYLVINKKHGAPSTRRYLEEIYGNCEVLDKDNGFYVLKCNKL